MVAMSKTSPPASTSRPGYTTRGNQNDLMLGEDIAPQAGVIRAILLEDSPCCGIPHLGRSAGRDDLRRRPQRPLRAHHRTAQPARVRTRRQPGELWSTAAIAVENPYCSCRLTGSGEEHRSGPATSGYKDYERAGHG